jgi:hypothetical protein
MHASPPSPSEAERSRLSGGRQIRRIFFVVAQVRSLADDMLRLDPEKEDAPPSWMRAGATPE